MKEPTQRFSSRVEDYKRYRPSYPDALVEYLIGHLGLNGESRVADLGSGTGLFSEKLLQHGLRVFGVEPNREMREASLAELSGYDGFQALDGSAERTGLEDASLDLISAAQAFHWFETDKVRAECERVLKPGGCVALIWNQRDDRRGFARDYESVLREYAVEYAGATHRNFDERAIADFFSGYETSRRCFDNSQQLDLAGVKGRLLSSSYVPEPGEKNHRQIMSAIESAFARHARDGVVGFDYETRLYLGCRD